MVKVFEGTPQEYYMDGYVQSVLDTAKKVIKDDWDMVFLIDGFEGSGKSVLAQQLAMYCDIKLILDNIIFNNKDFEERVKKAQPYDAIIFDEAYSGLNAKMWMRQTTQTIIRMLTEIRYKKLFIFIVLPTFYDLVKYVAIWRTRGLFHVYDDKFKRGFVAFYDKDKKKDLYVKGKKFYSYNQRLVKPNFIGRFVNHYCVDETEYKNKKRDNAEKIEVDEGRPDKHLERDNLIQMMYKKGLTYEKIGEYADLTKARIGQIINKRGI